MLTFLYGSPSEQGVRLRELLVLCRVALWCFVAGPALVSVSPPPPVGDSLTTPTFPFIDGRETREWIATVEPTAAAVGSDSPHEQRRRARSRADGSPAEESAPLRSSVRARSTVSACGRGTMR